MHEDKNREGYYIYLSPVLKLLSKNTLQSERVLPLIQNFIYNSKRM